MELTEGDKNFSERQIKTVMQITERFHRRYLKRKQSFDIILMKFQWQNFKIWQLPNFFGPGLDSMSPWHKRGKAENETNFRLDIE